MVSAIERANKHRSHVGLINERKKCNELNGKFEPPLFHCIDSNESIRKTSILFMFFIRDKESEEERERMKKTKEIATSAQNDLSIKSIKYKRNTNDEKIVKTK